MAPTKRPQPTTPLRPPVDWPITPSAARDQFLRVWNRVLDERGNESGRPDPDQQLHLAEQCPATDPLWERLCRMPIGCYYLTETADGKIDFSIPTGIDFDCRKPGEPMLDPDACKASPLTLWLRAIPADTCVIGMAAEEPDTLLPYTVLKPKYFPQQSITYWRAHQFDHADDEDISAQIAAVLSSLTYIDKCIGETAQRIAALSTSQAPAAASGSPPPQPHRSVRELLAARDPLFHQRKWEQELRALAHHAFIAGGFDHEAMALPHLATITRGDKMNPTNRAVRQKGAETKKLVRVRRAQEMARLMQARGEGRNERNERAMDYYTRVANALVAEYGGLWKPASVGGYLKEKLPSDAGSPAL